MASKLALGLGAIALLIVLAGILLFTIGRDAVNRKAADLLIRAATNDEEYALLARVGALAQENLEHPAFTCASEGSSWDTTLDPNETASAAGMPAGDWALGETGQEDGVPYATYYNPTGGASEGGAFDWREVNLAGETFTCMIPV